MKTVTATRFPEARTLRDEVEVARGEYITIARDYAEAGPWVSAAFTEEYNAAKRKFCVLLDAYKAANGLRIRA